MSNHKTIYSNLSSYYVGFVVPDSEKAQKDFLSSKKREADWNDNWKKYKVNINVLLDKYVPGVHPKIETVKAVYENNRYRLKADMASGYIRVFDKQKKTFLDINGNPSNDPATTHFKILKKRGNVVTITLINDTTGLHYYGYIPCNPEPLDSRVEVFQLEEPDRELLVNDFIDPINELCDSLLGDGDVDYLNKDKCVKMKGWLVNRFTPQMNPRLKELYLKLLDFSNRAIEKNTGIVIEL